MMGDRREFFKRGLSTLYLPFYAALCGVLGEEWQPYSGYRDFPAQTRLYAQGRTTPGGIVTNAKAGESAHNYGCATDWAYFHQGKLVWLQKTDSLWEKFTLAVEKVGLRPGSEWGDVDHAELRLACDWKHILLAYNASNMTGAQDKISESMSR